MASNQPFPSQSQQQNAASSASQGQRNIGYQASSHRQQASRNAAPNQQTNGTGASSWYDHLDNRTATTQHEGNDAYGVSSNGQRVYGNGVPIQDRRDGQNRATLYQSQQDDRVVNRYGSAVTTEPFAWQLPVSVQTVQSRPNPLTQQLPRQQPHQHPRQQPHHLSAPQPRPQPRPQQHRANRPQHNPHQHRHIPPNTAALPQQQPGSNQRVSGSLSQYITPRTAVPLSVALEYMPGLQFEDLTPYRPFHNPQGVMIQLPMMHDLRQARAYHAYLAHQRRRRLAPEPPVVNHQYSPQDARRYAPDM